MAIHVFYQGGYESKTVLVEADSEVEARGKAQKECLAGDVPTYKGVLADLIPESDVLRMNSL